MGGELSPSLELLGDGQEESVHVVAGLGRRLHVEGDLFILGVLL